MPEQREVRTCDSPPSVRAARAGSKDSIGTIRGYAARYGEWSQDLGGFREQLKPGSMTKVLATNPDCRCLVDHNSSKILARTTSGTLKLWEDSHGLVYEASVAPTQAGRDILASVKRGDITSSSFAFILAPGGDEWRSNNGKQERIITEIGGLLDVSAVTYPAYETATVEAASARAALQRHRGGTSRTPLLDAAKRRMAQSEARYRGRAAAEPTAAAKAAARWKTKEEMLAECTDERRGWVDWDLFYITRDRQRTAKLMSRHRRNLLEQQARRFRKQVQP